MAKTKSLHFFLCCLFQHTVKQRVVLPVIWDALTRMSIKEIWTGISKRVWVFHIKIWSCQYQWGFHYIDKTVLRPVCIYNGITYILKRLSVGLFNMQMLSYQYRDPHVKDKTVSRPSYLYHGNPYTWERRSLYWDGTLVFCRVTTNHSLWISVLTMFKNRILPNGSNPSAKY